MEEARSRSSSFSSSSSSNSWSIVENPEHKVREGIEVTDSELSSGLADDDLLYVREGCAEFRPDLLPLDNETATDCETESEEDDDISVVSESDEAGDEVPFAPPFVDVSRVSEQLDILSKCYDSPVERFFSQLFKSESRLKTFIVLVIAAFSLAVAVLANAAGSGWMNSVPSTVMESAYATFDGHLPGLQYREVDVTPLGPSVDLSLKPDTSWGLSQSPSSQDPPHTYFAQFQKPWTSDEDQMYSSLNQCDRTIYEREFSAMDEAVRRYVRHTTLRKKAHQTFNDPDSSSPPLSATHSEATESSTNESTHWRVPLLNMTIKKPKMLKSITERYTWRNVTASLLGLPFVANRVLHTSTVVKLVAESKVTARFHNALSMMKQSLDHRLARAKVHRDRVIRAVASSFAKFAMPSGHKLWSKLSKLARKVGERETCSAPNVCCDAFTKLAGVLRELPLFASLIGEANAQMYMESLQHPTACTEARIGCEKCWWTGECPKTRCTFLHWQRSFNTRRFTAAQRDHFASVFAGLGWKLPGSRTSQNILTESEEKTIDGSQSGKKIVVETRSESSGGRSGDWFFERGRQRAMQRGRRTR